MRSVKKEYLNKIYMIEMTEWHDSYREHHHYEVYEVMVSRYRYNGNYNNYDDKGEYVGMPRAVDGQVANSILEALLVYKKLRQKWRHCYS